MRFLKILFIFLSICALFSFLGNTKAFAQTFTPPDQCHSFFPERLWPMVCDLPQPITQEEACHNCINFFNAYDPHCEPLCRNVQPNCYTPTGAGDPGSQCISAGQRMCGSPVRCCPSVAACIQFQALPPIPNPLPTTKTLTTCGEQCPTGFSYCTCPTTCNAQTVGPTQTCGGTRDPNTEVPGMTPINFSDVDPLQLGGSDNPFERTTASNVDFSTPGKILSRALQFAIPLAGLILFVMIVWGGFEMVLGSADAKSKEAGQQRITAAVLGFVLLFASYWIARLIEIIFSINFLS